MIPDRFSDAYDPEPYDGPTRSDFANEEPRRPPCGGPCSPEGCRSRHCWQDYPPEDEE